MIKHMVRDLNLPVEIVSHLTVRDEHGLALSSRNRRLQLPEEIEASYAVSGILNCAVQKIKSGETNPVQTFSAAMEEVFQTLSPAARGLFDLEYLEAVDAETFDPLFELRPGAKILIAANVRTQTTGDVRLIDNLNV